MSDAFKNVHDIIDARSELRYKIDDYLRSKGWEHTSTSPGSYWMWRREISGVTYMVHQDQAVRIQGTLESEEGKESEAQS